MAAQFEIRSIEKSQLRFVLTTAEGEILLISQAYHSMHGIRAGIKSAKVNAPYDRNYARSVTARGMHCFTLHAADGELIGSSTEYESPAQRDEAIAAVKKLAPAAQTVELAS